MSRVADLRDGMKFQAPEIPGYAHATMRVEETGPSRNKEGHRRLVVRFKNGRSGSTKILTLPDDMTVHVVWSPEWAKPKPPPKPKCTCRNHMGSKKIKHRSREAAVAAILKRHLHHGGHSVYPCPKEPGIFHVRSQKMRLDS